MRRSFVLYLPLCAGVSRHNDSYESIPSLEIYIDCGDLLVAAVYTLPNFYGESPAVQVSPGKATVKVTEQTLKTVEDALAVAQIKPNGVFFEQGAQQNSVRVRLLRQTANFSFAPATCLKKH